MKKVLVTGADGFIGSHLTEALVRKGYETKAFVFYNSFNSWGWLDRSAKEVQGKFEVFSGDILIRRNIGKNIQYNLSYFFNSHYFSPNLLITLILIEDRADFNTNFTYFE